MNLTKLAPRVQTCMRGFTTYGRLPTIARRPVTLIQSSPKPALHTALPRDSTSLYSSRRAYSTEGGPPRSGGVWSPLFTALFAFGIAATGYGVYELYGTLTMWPQEVRGDLREALKAKYKPDYSMCAAYFQRAWETAKSIPLESFKSQPHLKTSGIAICLGEVLEADNKQSEAYDVYVDALKRIQDAGIKDLSGPEKMRAVSLAYKLGELCDVLEKPKEEQEKWLTFGVETLIQNVLKVIPATNGQGTPQEEADSHNIITELGLPDWVSTVDVAAPFEALGTFYSKAGKLDYAMPLMLQAVSILIPPSPQESTPEDKCRGAQLMTSISEMIVRNKLTRETVQQAEQWAMKGLEVVVTTRKASKEPIGICEVSYAVQLFNMASLRAIGGDINKAKDLFARAANQAKLIGYKSLVDTSNQAIEDLNSRTAAAPQTS
ncbi:hypothetical protein AGABI1DRAFT_115251 [Agaricus bisporus var. burnettii JB137-S8]|uniref:Uncharacterized protein n=1 Tax=Agaricus bisporus var. burnettii (strain JB137-S8 / ATCC MYA-4627 / FGSC 10392) TaxID=597362 RepID=K5WPP1_AGABU|nr:uncharacterized protein AGABI1DRAFT_115251 [Agaricus bisporus var. burnettii JB137-S8]EKM77321.1 hypothetical protein AGABI1DRAFT_115251 [Agaricus bisporus var. burnettii JB137-S8]